MKVNGKTYDEQKAKTSLLQNKLWSLKKTRQCNETYGEARKA